MYAVAGASACGRGAGPAPPEAAPTHRFQWSQELRDSLEERSGGRAYASHSSMIRMVRENDDWVRAQRGRGGYRLPVTEVLECDVSGQWHRELPLEWRTEVCVANIDTLRALLALQDLGRTSCAALNFANASTPGGGYLWGARAQEEDLCRMLPELYQSLAAAQYPIKPDTALVTEGLHAARHVDVSQYPAFRCHEEPSPVCCIISSAMPNLKSGYTWEGGEWLSLQDVQKWSFAVRRRIRAVLFAAVAKNIRSLVLGAFGCGAYRNPPYHVAHIFCDELLSQRFRGAFRDVVFAIVDPKADATWTGNFATFVDVVQRRLGDEADVAANRGTLPAEGRQHEGAGPSGADATNPAAATPPPWPSGGGDGRGSHAAGSQRRSQSHAAARCW